MPRYPVIPGAEAWSAAGHGARADIGIVTLHGFTGCPVSMRPLAEALASRGFTVELPRLPGHGTHVRDMAKSRYEHWRREAELTLTRLQKRVRSTLLVGLSMGGTLSLDITARRPEVAGVVAINALILNREDIGSKLAPIIDRLLPIVPASVAGLAKNDMAKPGGDEKAYSWLPPRAGSSLLRELPRIRRQLADLRTPALVAYSPQDHSVSPDNSRAILRMLGSDDVTELRLERSYHVATLDYDLELLVERITEFADRVSQRTARGAASNANASASAS